MDYYQLLETEQAIAFVKERFERQEKKTIMLSPRRKFFSIHKPKKKKRESRSKFRE